MASVPEEERSEGGRTYTVSSNSDQDGEISNEASVNGDDQKVEVNGATDHAHLSPASSPTSDDPSPKKSFATTTDSYYTARGKSSNDTYYTGRESIERCSPLRDRSVVYDPTRNSYIPRDPECPIHSPKPGSLRTSPCRTAPTTPTRESPTRPFSLTTPSTPTRESPTRPFSFSRNSPTRVTPPRTSPIRTSVSRTSPNRITSPRMSPTLSPQQRCSPVRMDSRGSRTSVDGPIGSPTRSSPLVMGGSRTSIGGASSSPRSGGSPTGGSPSGSLSAHVHPSARNSAAESELLHCTICTKQFNNPKVLPCLHSFCESCLLSTTPAEALTISCPQCKQQSILPQAGVTHLQSNSWVQGVIDSLEVPQPVEGTRPSVEGGSSVPVCGLCPDGAASAAASRCIKCNLALCGTCEALHKKESEHEQYESVAVSSGYSDTCSSDGGAVEGGSAAAAAAGGLVAHAGAPPAEGTHSFQDDLHCPSHEGMTLRFYCRDCDTAVCISCTDIEHRLHSTTRLSEAMHDQTTAMHSLVDAVANKLPAVTCCIEDLGESIETLSSKREEAEAAIRATFLQLREQLQAREQQLIDALQHKMDDKKNMLESQRSELQGWVAGMESSSELVKKAVQESKAPMDLVMLKKQFGDRLKEHVNADLPPGPRENTLLSFETSHVESCMSLLGRVGSVVTNPAVPYTTIASGDNLKQVPVGRRGHITVITRDFKAERVSVGGAELTAVFTPKCQISTPSPPLSPCSYSSKTSSQNLQVPTPTTTPNPPSATATTTPTFHSQTPPPRAASEKSSSPQPQVNGHHLHQAPHHHPHHYTNGHPSVRRASPSEEISSTHDCSVKVIDHNNGVYNVEFILLRAGKYSLDLNLYGMPIDQSPFTVTAVPMGSSCSIHGSDHSTDSPYAPVRTRNSARFSTLSTRTPKGSRNTPSQRSSGSRVTLPIEDDLIMKIGIKGRNKGEFVNPQGICYSDIRGGRIVVTDSISQCVQVFTSDGEFKTRFGTRGRNVGQLQRPTGVTTLPNGNYAVADYENKCVSVFEPNGKYVYRIGQGKLFGPKGVCADRHGNMIVVDNKGSCICIFSSSGRLISKFGNRGVNYLQFAGPHFVAVNSKDHIVATDFHNHCVKVFDCEGEFLYTFGCHGEGNGQFNAPTGIAVDDNDNIIVADWGNCRIQVFDSRGSFLSYINTLADPLHGPQGLTITGDGHIVVADSGNHCYKVYKYLQ